MAVRTPPTPAQVKVKHAQALWQLRNWGPRSTYMAETMRAVLDTFDWVAGDGPAPLSGELAADRDGLALEEARARDLEVATLGTPAAVRPGRVLLTLAWLAGDETAESPV